MILHSQLMFVGRWNMYRSRLKAKALLLLCLSVFLMLLVVRDPDRKGMQQGGETGEELLIPEEKNDEHTGEVIVPGKTWTSPGKDAKIRVLLLDTDGSIYHKEKDAGEGYPGELAYYEEPQGWVIVNEVPLEEYLRYVVPSEMPSTYSMEALKAQAVCARTYAVWQMQEYAYPEYKAHVDDSTSYQVYHNIDSQPTTDQAVEETAGQILLYEDWPIKAYYFATSCGVTTDEAIWEEGDTENSPYLRSRFVNEESSEMDLTDEETFATYIKKKRAGDLEISEPWYRWNCEISLTQIQKNLEKWMAVRLAKTGDGILIEKNGEYIRPTENKSHTGIGTITGAQILSRNTGGAAQELLLIGSEGTLKIRYEYNIRLMLGLPGGIIHKNDGTITKGGDLLPSGYFVLDPVESDGTVTGYTVTGGGLGHGAGMSQNGARLLAEQGKDYLSILQYFYRDVTLAELE